MTLMELLALLRRGFRLIAVAVAAGALLGAAWAQATPTTYAATATLGVVPHSGQGPRGESGPAGPVGDHMQTFSAAASTAQVLLPVKQQLGLEESVPQLRQRVRVRVPAAATLLEITATAPDADSAVALADATAGSLSGAIGKLVPGTGSQPGVSTVTLQQGADAVVHEGASLPLFTVAGAAFGLVAGVLAVRAREAAANRRDLESRVAGAARNGALG